MFDIIFAISIVGSIIGIFKEACTPEIPAENFANQELYRNDIKRGMPVEERMKGVDNGRYRLTEKYPEPHRDPESGKIIIENCKLYYDDVEKYGAVKARQWMKQGKYNLSPEELEKERERIRAKYGFSHH